MDAGRAVFAQEHVPVTVRMRSFRIPGQFAYGKKVFLRGSIMLAPDVVSASLSSRLLLVWLPWAEVPADAQGAVELREDGLHIRYDVPRIIDGGRGEVLFSYRFSAPDDVRAWLPVRTAPLTIDPGVFAALCWDHLGG